LTELFQIITAAAHLMLTIFKSVLANFNKVLPDCHDNSNLFGVCACVS